MESKKRRPQRRLASCFVHQALEGPSIKIIEYQTVTVMIDQRPRVYWHRVLLTGGCSPILTFWEA